MVEVSVIKVMRSVNPLSESMIDKAREAGVDTSGMKCAWDFSAVVERAGRTERWPITLDQANAIIVEGARLGVRRIPFTLQPAAKSLPV